MLRRDPLVVSIYLRRGYAKGEHMPGISDIDLGVVVRADYHPDSEAAKYLRKRYRILRQIFPLLDPFMETHTEVQIKEMHRSCAIRRFRFEEGRRFSVRLAGPPVFESLPPLPEAVWPDALRNESNMWWALFSEHLLNGNTVPPDPLLSGAMCVKSIGESFRMRCALETGILPRTRREALLWAEETKGAEHEMAAEARALLDRRFQRLPEDLSQRTFAFLLNHAEEFHSILSQQGRETDPRHPRQTVEDNPAGRCSQSVDLPSGTMTCFSAFWPVGENLCVLPFPISLAALQEQVTTIRAQPETRRAQLFFRHKDLLFQVGEKEILCRGRSVLHPLVNAETFAGLDPVRFPLERARWTECQESSYVNWRVQYYWWNKYRGYFQALPPSARCGWIVKTIQLEAIRRSALRGEVVYPLTLAAVERAADREGITIPPEHRPLFSPDAGTRAAAAEKLGSCPLEF